MAYVPKYLAADGSDISNALSPATFLALLDDNGDGAADTGPLLSVLQRAEGIVDAFISTELTLPLNDAQDRYIFEAALELAIGFSFERRPEYVRNMGGMEGRGGSNVNHYARAMDLLAKAKSGQVKLPDNNAAQPAKNLGGIIYDNGPRMIIDGSDGTDNGGIF